jgi:hypothetical protein
MVSPADSIYIGSTRISSDLLTFLCAQEKTSCGFFETDTLLDSLRPISPELLEIFRQISPKPESIKQISHPVSRDSDRPGKSTQKICQIVRTVGLEEFLAPPSDS